VGRRRRPRRLALPVAAVRVHHAKIMLGMLIEVLGGDAIAAQGRLPRQRHVALEHLIGVAAYLDAPSAAVEGLDPMRTALAVRIVRIVVGVVRVAGIVGIAPASLVLPWSHDTFEI